MKTILVIITILLIGFGLYYFLYQNKTISQISVSEPLSGTLIKSPLVVKGTARGNWYFEASFPVKVLDANGRLLGSAPAQAQGEWMTTEFVPFLGQVSFEPATTPTGTLVFEKDNPSGLPENASEIRVPIRFK